MWLLLIFYSMALLLFTSCSVSISYSTDGTADDVVAPITNPSTTQTFVVPNNYTTYTDENSLFSISYPEQWEPDSNLANATAQMTQDINNLKNGLSVTNTESKYHLTSITLVVPISHPAFH
jgi:hypothetical protein